MLARKGIPMMLSCLVPSERFMRHWLAELHSTFIVKKTSIKKVEPSNRKFFRKNEPHHHT
jgi:hypothetical protein